MQFAQEEEQLLELPVPYHLQGQSYGQYLAERAAKVRAEQADKDRHASQELFNKMMQELNVAASQGKTYVQFKYRAISNIETGLSPLIHKSMKLHNINYSMVQLPTASEEEQKNGEFGEGIINLILPTMLMTF